MDNVHSCTIIAEYTQEDGQRARVMYVWWDETKHSSQYETKYGKMMAVWNVKINIFFEQQQVTTTTSPSP